ncbi:MAG: DUF1957 domain-containing protein [Gemmatimonadetes bacterium]|nr:DUF1957 domain-containing protein [Gemmatimonadota bacterium]
MSAGMDFVLVLHSHLPYVLNHGRWPHGSDWVCEAALDTYLPLLDTLRSLEADGVNAPVTFGITPILAVQLASPVFRKELEAFLDQRITACIECEGSLPGTADAGLITNTRWWHEHYMRLLGIWQSIDGDIVSAVRRFEENGRLELTTSAATHGFLPLLARDESIRLQLVAGRMEHERLFGKRARGLWLPECAYRPRGTWKPLPVAPGNGAIRAGIESFLAEAEVRFVTIDAHLARAGESLGLYGEVATTQGELLRKGVLIESGRRRHSPYRTYRLGRARGATATRVLVRDPRSSFRVWSRHEGYPGDGAYLEFHKIRFPGGLKLWRVTDSTADLGQKLPYEPEQAKQAVARHGEDFATLLGAIAARGMDPLREVVVAPFDTELFGHWWHEGVAFLGALYRALPRHANVRAVTASQHIARAKSDSGVALAPGSWGANGDFSMWMNPGVEWTWEHIWPLEEKFWGIAQAALDDPSRHAVLAQAARSLLLLQSSDWQFIISTGEVADYAERRFIQHAEETARLLAALHDEPGVSLGAAADLAGQLRQRDDVFPGVLDAVREVLQLSPAAPA